jgi:hypothetical protein
MVRCLLRRGTDSAHNLLNCGITLSVLCFDLEDDTVALDVFDHGIVKRIAFPGEVRSSTWRGNNSPIHFSLVRPDDSRELGFGDQDTG